MKSGVCGTARDTRRSRMISWTLVISMPYSSRARREAARVVEPASRLARTILLADV